MSEKNTNNTINSQQIKNILPHRYPFQLVDKVTQINDNTITAIKNVTINEPFFQGHFPSEPIMPGVLQIEAMIQAAGILVLHKYQNPQNYNTYFVSIEKCKFRAKVTPGDTLIIQAKLISSIKRGFAKFQCQASANQNTTCQATMMATIRKK